MVRMIKIGNAIGMISIIKKTFEMFTPRFVLKILQYLTIYRPRMKELGITQSFIPLFKAVYFEVRTKCNNRCEFCAASIQNDTRRDNMMSRETYDNVISQLKEINFSGRVAYHVNNDPLLFPHLLEFVDYARRELPNAWIQILTNGLKLSVRKAEDLVRAGINELTINYYMQDNDKNIPTKFYKIRHEILPEFFNPHQIKEGHGPSRDEDKVFRFNLIKRNISDVLTSRAGTAPNKKKKSAKPRGFCAYPFTQFNITANGTVNKCCADFFFSDPMGNVNKEKILDIWKGKRFSQVRKLLFKGNRNANEQCQNCDEYGLWRLYIHSRIGKYIYSITK